jgi:NADH-quinone oxidoreductase subunit N
MAGFFSKFLVLLSIISKEYFLSSIIIVLISSMACFYYLRLLKMVFFKNNVKSDFWVSGSSRKIGELVISLLVTFNVLFFVFPDSLSYFCLVLGLILF